MRLADALCEMGRYGQKTGAGWYRYDETRKPIPDPEVDALIARERDRIDARRALGQSGTGVRVIIFPLILAVRKDRD